MTKKHGRKNGTLLLLLTLCLKSEKIYIALQKFYSLIYTKKINDNNNNNNKQQQQTNKQLQQQSDV